MIKSKAFPLNCRCEYLKNPLAIDAVSPRLSWEMQDAEHNAVQSAYRILVADSTESLKANIGNLWDSGKVDGNQSFQIHYRGKKLKSSQTAFWKVMLWDATQNPGAWSKPASFTMGLLDIKEWKAKWIGTYLANSPACPIMRKEFKIKTNIKRALLYSTAKGVQHLTLNGKEISDDLFAPGWTDYDKRLHYRCYDLTKMLNKSTRHCLGAEIGNGWFKGRIASEHMGTTYGHRVGLLAQLKIEYNNGKSEWVYTDETWKTIFGPTRHVDLYDGETYDAQLEPKGWNRVGFNDENWEPVFLLRRAMPENLLLKPYPAEPVRITQTLKPIKFWSIAPGKVIYDFGQNFAGWVRLHFKGKAGCVLRMRFGEMVNKDNSLYIDNMRSAACTDTYVMKGVKREVWEPKFSFHGFRYVEMSGSPVAPSLNNLSGMVIGSDTTRVGHFECSSQLVNQIYSNAVWTQRANFLEVPTDCPQRDERLGWTGDAQVFIRTAINNMDVAAFFTKWMADLLDSQYEDGAFPNIAPDVLKSKGGAAWGDAGVVCPWTLYQCYEDRDILAKMYPAMKRWVAYLKNTSNNLLCDSVGCCGDWLAVNAKTPDTVIRTAHFAYATDITRKAAEVLNQKADVKKYASLFNAIKEVFNKHFVKSNGKIEGDTQTGYLMALKFGLLTPIKSKLAAKHLVADIRKKKMHSSTGFVGTALIMSVLRDSGNLDIAYKLLENTSYPSWGYSVVNGATTIWERWNSWTKEGGPGDVSMNSYSHYAYGAVVEWMFDTIAGIDHQGCGFQKFTLKPQPGGSLKHASASFHSPYGLIRSAWKKSAKQTHYEISIPANTQANVILPTKSIEKVKLNGRPLKKSGVEVDLDGSFCLGAGEYKIIWT